ncbi:MAG: SDR family oxidoreductase [Deltaproteobacteria bacterium]|nr:SDR family oxidoreductase [Deltaproteobacteria bacterium]
MRTAIVTGANRGIGLELCRQLSHRGDNVVAVCRKSSPALDALGIKIIDAIDVGDTSTMPKLIEATKGMSLDLLINNAGVLATDTFDAFNEEGMRQQFEVNTLGPLRVTRALIDRLNQGARVGIVTSRMGSIADNTSGGYYGYRMSKAGVNAIGKSMSIDLRARGIAVVLLHPGFVRTEMTQGAGQIDAETSARGLLKQIDATTLENTGRFMHMSGEELPW